MGMAAVGFLLHQVGFHIVLRFLMGAQSTFFGPVKYALLPQVLREDELVGGNGLVEIGTFLAILLGTLLGGLLTGLSRGPALIGLVLIAPAGLGYWTSRRIPVAPAADPELKLAWNLLGETIRIVGSARRNRTVFHSILGISRRAGSPATESSARFGRGSRRSSLAPRPRWCRWTC